MDSSSGPITTATQPPPPTMFRNIDDFMKEQEEIEQSKAKAVPSQIQPKKKATRVIDVEALANEARAIEELGEVNWTGKLLGK